MGISRHVVIQVMNDVMNTRCSFGCVLLLNQIFTALHGMQRGLTMRFLSVRLSVRPSVCLSNACIVTKRKKAMFRFLYHMKDHLS